MPGQTHDLAGTPPLLEDLPFAALIGDRAFDVTLLLRRSLLRKSLLRKFSRMWMSAVPWR